jgi:hypothetical protein
MGGSNGIPWGALWRDGGYLALISVGAYRHSWVIISIALAVSIIRSEIIAGRK